MNTSLLHRFFPLLLGTAVLIGMAANPHMGGCNEGHAPGSDVPDTTGDWAIAYDDTLDVTVKLGGSVYTHSLPAAGGTFTVSHGGVDLAFDLDCERPEVLCPSEAWPETITVVQKANVFNEVTVTLPSQWCEGELVPPDPETCGDATANPDCEDVCEGELVVTESQRFGTVSQNGQVFTVLLGAGAVSNGLNCAALGLSVAEARLSTTGAAATGDWVAHGMDDGEVKVGYAGGCLWAGDPDHDGAIEGLLLGASITLETGFTGVRLD